MFYFRTSFEAPQISVKTKIYIFYFNYFKMRGTGRVNNFFSDGIFKSKKMVTNMKLATTNVPFRHNSACVIQKWLRFKWMIILVRLVYISYFLMDPK